MLSANGYRQGLVNPGLSRWIALATARVIQWRSALDSNHFQELAQKFGAQIDNLVRRPLELIAGDPFAEIAELHSIDGLMIADMQFSWVLDFSGETLILEWYSDGDGRGRKIALNIKTKFK